MARRHRSLSEIRSEHTDRLETALARAVRAALEDSDGVVVRAAGLLGAHPTEVRRIVDRHPELSALARKGAGRPKSSAESAA